MFSFINDYITQMLLKEKGLNYPMGLKKLLLPWALVTASAISSLVGCQSIATERFKDPERANLFVRWGADVQNNLDAKFPRRYEPAANETLKSFEKIFGSTISTVNNTFGLVGLHPLDRVLDFENKENWNYDPRNRDDPNTERGIRKVLVQPIVGTSNLLNSAGRLVGNTLKSGTQIVNLPLVMISPNTRELADLRGEIEREDYNPYNDSAKLWADGTTDLIKIPLKSAMYAVTESSIIPDGWKLGIERMERWGGYEIKDKTLEYKFRQEDGTTNGGRVAINCIPFIAGLADQAWRTKYIEREFNSGNYVGKNLSRVVNTSDNYLRTDLVSDKSWYSKVDPSRAIGIVKEGKFYPAKSSVLEGLKLGGLILNASGSSAGGPDGGVTGGGGEGGSTGR
jgi:hypothetical protein